MLKIKLTPMEADETFPTDENGAPMGHNEELVQRFLAEVSANAGPLDLGTPCTEWKYFNAYDHSIYEDEHGDSVTQIGECKFGEETIQWYCIF